jgi:hypothetical protein
VVDARKVSFALADLTALFKGARRVVVAKGKTASELALKPEALAATLGPGGNLRAPALRVGDTWLVGFNESAWASVFDGQ